jgi:hypothetical protein
MHPLLQFYPLRAYVPRPEGSNASRILAASLAI